jgi:hypothetical protein
MANQPCYRGPPETWGVGECQSLGVQFCGEGQWGPCVEGSAPTTEVCNAKDDDCDGEVDEDFPHPEIGGCNDTRRRLGSISGDTHIGELILTATGWYEEWLEVSVSEDDHTFLTPRSLGVWIRLTGAATHNYDLVVRCAKCAASAVAPAADWWPYDDERELPFTVADGWLTDDDIVLLVWVKHIGGPVCQSNPWTLTVSNERGIATTGWRQCP